jgi:hypothetical protein
MAVADGNMQIASVTIQKIEKYSMKNQNSPICAFNAGSGGRGWSILVKIYLKNCQKCIFTTISDYTAFCRKMEKKVLKIG